MLGKYGYERGLKRQRVWNNLAKIEGMEWGKRERMCVCRVCVGGVERDGTLVTSDERSR